MPPRRWLRLLYGAAAFLLLCFSFELLLFSTPAFPTLFTLALGGRVSVRYSAAWSVWPGTMHVRDLELTGQDDNVQWNLGIDKVVFSVSLLGLLHREFHATHVRGEGVLWALRFKHELADLTPQEIYGIPYITGMDPLPLRHFDPGPPDTDANYHLWTIHLEDVDARHAREIWIDKLHLIGDAHITGGFFLKPIRHVEVMAQLEASPLELLLGDDIVARELRGRIAVTVLPFDPRAGGAMSKVDVAASLDGVGGTLSFLKRLLPDDIKISAEPGPLHIRATVENGVLKPASDIALTTAHLRVARAPFLLDSAATLSLQTTSAAPSARTMGAAALDLTQLQIAVQGSRAAPLEARRMRIALLSQQLNLASPLGMSGFLADLEDARIPDLRLLESLLPRGSKLRIEGGRAELHGHVDSSAPAPGSLLFSIRESRTRFADVQLRADADGELVVHGREIAWGPIDLSASHLSIDRASVTGASGHDWWGRFELPQASFDPDTKGVALELLGQCTDARPLRALFAVEGVPGFVATLFNMTHLQVAAGLRAAPGLIALRDLDAHGDNASIRANYESRGDEKRGEALLKLGISAAGLDLDGGKPRVVLIGATSWFEGRLKAKPSAHAATP